MDDLELTELFVKRRKLMDEITKVDIEITNAVMERKESFAAAGVRASFYNPSRKFDYEATANKHNAPKHIIEEHTTKSESISWKNVCLALPLSEDDYVYEDQPARVVVK